MSDTDPTDTDLSTADDAPTATDDTGDTDDTDTLLVTATGESTGKTALTVALGVLAQGRGLRVKYMKPKGTRLESHLGKTLDTDPLLARRVLGLDDDIETMEPVVYSPTFVEEAIRGAERPADIHRAVRACYDRLAADADLVLIEGGGSHTTGGVVDLTDPDVAALLDARTLVVGEYDTPGDLDDLLAAVHDVRAGSEALPEAEADRDPASRLAGVVFNRVTDGAFDTVEGDVAAYLDARDAPVRGVLPRTRDLAGVTVDALETALGADRLTAPGDGGREDFVERFHVGAMSGDAALRQFRRTTDAAVITGGDRADVQTAAIEAPGVTCLVLTGGHRPSGAVLGRAEEAGLPVLVVDADTLTTVERAEAVVSGGRTRDAYAVERMGELLTAHADVDAILGGN